MESHHSNTCQDSCERVAVASQRPGAGSKPPVFSHSISSPLTSTRPAGSTFLAPACLGLVSAVLPTWLCLAPGTQLFYLPLPLSLACLAPWETLLLVAPRGMAWTLTATKCEGFSYFQPRCLSSALVYLLLLRQSTWTSLVCFRLVFRLTFPSPPALLGLL